MCPRTWSRTWRPGRGGTPADPPAGAGGRLTLYGFSTGEQLRLFELLISVSGIGPVQALGIVSLGDPDAVESAIAAATRSTS
ncbi:MAG: hypothetical protein WKH64_03605 [Chloroflexia bacterium]